MSSKKFIDVHDQHLQRNFLCAPMCGDSKLRISGFVQTRFMASVLGDMSGGNKRNEHIVRVPKLHISFCKITRSGNKNLITFRVIPKLEHYPLSTCCVYFFNSSLDQLHNLRSSIPSTASGRTLLSWKEVYRQKISHVVKLGTWKHQLSSIVCMTYFMLWI
jgi:hypothetical protein